jgi:hypothetical protein
MNPTGTSGSGTLCGWHPCQQGGRRTVIGAAQLGPLPHHRPAVVWTSSSVWPVRSSARSRSPGVAVAAEELGHLDVHGGLHDQPHAEPPDFLNDRGRVRAWRRTACRERGCSDRDSLADPRR